MKYFFSTILIFGFLSLNAQTKTDTTGIEFRRIRAGVDVYGLIKSAVTPGISEFEISGDIDLRKYLLSLDIGRSSTAIDSLPRYRYEMSGNYFRIGLDANFLKNDIDGSIISFGLRYGRASFDDQLDYEYNSPILGSYPDKTAMNDNATARWLEAGLAMKAKIWKNVWMGYRASYKFGLKTKFGEFEPHRIPGYGPAETNTDSNSYWGFNYYLQIGIGLKKRSPKVPQVIPEI